MGALRCKYHSKRFVFCTIMILNLKRNELSAVFHIIDVNNIFFLLNSAKIKVLRKYYFVINLEVVEIMLES